MKRHLVLLITAALVVFCAFVLAAAMVPSACPSGWHKLLDLVVVVLLVAGGVVWVGSSDGALGHDRTGVSVT